MIENQRLVKKYGRRMVVDKVSFCVNQGEVVGLLGPNGAGKTTTFNMIVGLVKPDEGSVELSTLNGYYNKAHVQREREREEGWA